MDEIVPITDNGKGNETDATMFIVPVVCYADFNQDGVVNTQDIDDYLSAWFEGDTTADTNQDDAVTTQDQFDFLDAWAAGCGPPS